MEIVYCSKCGKMIPPGGVNEGKRYLVGGEAVCPKCYEKLPKEEHTGGTMVVSEGIGLRPASREPEPDYSPRPRTGKLTMPAAKRRPSTRAHPVVGGESRRSGLPVLLGAGVAVLVLAGVVVWLVLAGPGRQSSGTGRNPGTVTRPPTGNTEPPPPSQPSPTPTVDEAGMRAAFADAEAARTKNPEDYAAAIALFEKLRDKGRGSHWETDADKAIAEILSARETAASAEMEKLRAECRKLVEAGDFDGALAALENPPEKSAELLAGRLGVEREALRRQAAERLGAALTAAEQFSKDGEPDKGLIELDGAAAVKYVAWADRLKAMRERLEREKADVAATAERKLKADAARTLSGILDGFEELVLAGKPSEAAAHLTAEKARIAAVQQPLIAAQLTAAGKLAGTLEAQDAWRRAELGKLAGRELELALKDGQKLAGKVAEVVDGGLKLEITYKKGPTEIVQVRHVAFEELAPGQIEKLAPRPESKDADEQLAAAVTAIAGGDAAAAGKALAAAGEHPLAARWARRLDVVSLGEKEAAAKRAWEDLVAKLVREKYSGAEISALASGLEAYLLAYGRTAFARAKADEVEGLRSVVRMPALFKGKVAKFDPQTLDIVLFYDFETPEQAADWTKGSVKDGKLRVPGGGHWRHMGSLEDFSVSFQYRLLGVGHLLVGNVNFYNRMPMFDGVRIWEVDGATHKVDVAGPHTVAVLKEGARCVLNIDGKQVWDVTSEAHILRDPQTGRNAIFRMVVDNRVENEEGEFDNLRLSGRLDRAWLEKALRRFGSPASPGPATGLVAHWKLDEPSGDVALDSSGAGRNARLSGNPERVPGKSGGALRFAGPGKEVALPGDLSIKTGAVTLAAWVRHDKLTAGYQRYLVLADEAAAIRFSGPGGPRLESFIKTDGGIHRLYGPKGVPEGEWFHVAGTWDGTIQRLYMNGKMVAESRPGGRLVATTGGRIGVAGAESMCGLVDEVRIYDRALSPAEVAALAGAGSGPFRESGGRAVIEAESFHAMQPGTGAGEGTSWEKVTDIAGASGACALRALPRTKKAYFPNEQVGARLDYRVAFEKTGAYRVWVRLAAGAEECDTVFAGLNGKPAAGSASIRAGLNGWEWSSSDGRIPATVEVTRPGVHVLNIWVRESRTCLDKIILSAEAGFKPEDAGPEESPQAVEGASSGASAGPGPGQVSLLDPKAAKVVDGALSRVKLGETVTVDGRERANCIVMHSTRMWETAVVVFDLNGDYSTFEAELAEVGGDGRRVYEFIVSGSPQGQFKAGTDKPVPPSCRLDVTGVKKLYLKCWIGKTPPPDARAVWINPRLTRAGGGKELPAGK